MADRTAPYPAYNYLVDLRGPRDPEKLLGGFSDVSGLTTEIHISEYRDGNEPDTVRIYQIPVAPFSKAELFPDISLGDAPT